jgi:predicted O-methyltransferase YrrM
VRRVADYISDRTVERVELKMQAAQDAEQRAAMWRYRQLEATVSLGTTLSLRAPLPPLGGYPISADFALAIIDAIDETDAELVVELGSGASTVIAAYRLEGRGHGRLCSLEHLTDYANDTRALLARHGFDAERVDVRDAPLHDIDLDGDVYPWYDLRAIDDLTAIDVVVVDGPPGPSHPLARYPALPLLHDRVRSGGIVLLDDGNRDEEREIVRRWRTALPDWSADELDVEKGAFRLRKP